MFKGISTQQIFHRGKQLFSISLFAAFTLPTTSAIAAQVAKLNNWRFYPEAGKLEINLSVGKTPNYFYLSEPPRIVVDIPDTKLGYIPTQKNYTGAVQRVRVSQLNANITRIVLDLANGVVLDPNQVKLQPISQQNPTRWVLRPFISGSRQLSNTKNPPRSSPPTQFTQYNYLQLPSTLTPTFASPQQPLVTVPPLNSSNPVKTQNSSPSFPTPTISSQPNSPPKVTNPIVIEFGQPIPKLRN
ncbi:MAG TPA: AMIN domain-containing protein [Trichormus sp. M33_DOE_039]|nr:AMIN domain-containing protein [Trichormus sp. M33_DOE_039]